MVLIKKYDMHQKMLKLDYESIVGNPPQKSTFTTLNVSDCKQRKRGTSCDFTYSMLYNVVKTSSTQ